MLGEDIYDNSLDNEHKCQIMATLGGVYENNKEVTLTVVVDTALAHRLKFESATGDDVVAMPDNYYTLPSGKEQTIVIPLRITGVINADSILIGKSDLANLKQ